MKGVEWMKDGKKIGEGNFSPKFIVQHPFPEDESNTTLVYTLTVRNVDENDEGVYECRVFSWYSGADPETTATLSLKISREPGKTLV